MSAGTPPTLVVVGASGYLGGRVAALARPRYGVLATYHSHPPPGTGGQALDLRDHDAIDVCIAAAAPAVVVNCAYVQHGPDVDAVTAIAPGRLAGAAQRAGARFVHLSSDVVFPGRTDRAYREDDQPAPVHDYGRAKLRAEQAVLAAHQAPLIIRTSLIYRGAGDKTGAAHGPGAEDGPQERMVRAALAGDDVWFFTDEVRNPIAVDVLASAILELVALGQHGVFHVAGADAVDRLTFARLLATAMQAHAGALRGRPHDPAAAPRPGNLTLDCTKARTVLRDTVLTGAREALSRRARRSDRGS